MIAKLFRQVHEIIEDQNLNIRSSGQCSLGEVCLASSFVIGFSTFIRWVIAVQRCSYEVLIEDHLF